jgi:hypothetical protein
MKNLPTKEHAQMFFMMMEHMLLETCRRNEGPNKKNDLKSVHFVGLRYIITTAEVLFVLLTHNSPLPITLPSSLSKIFLLFECTFEEPC